MRYTVVAGDSLSAIAARHGVVLKAILDANPELGPDHDHIDIGQVINVPSPGEEPVAPSPAPSPDGHSAAPSASLSGWVLGGLSTRYETGSRGPTTIFRGDGDAGGVSYGSYQMTSVGAEPSADS
jgi:LysM repeat protein